MLRRVHFSYCNWQCTLLHMSKILGLTTTVGYAYLPNVLSYFHGQFPSVMAQSLLYNLSHTFIQSDILNTPFHHYSMFILYGYKYQNTNLQMMHSKILLNRLTFTPSEIFTCCVGHVGSDQYTQNTFQFHHKCSCILEKFKYTLCSYICCNAQTVHHKNA